MCGAQAGAAIAAAAYEACLILHENGRLTEDVAGDRFTLLQMAHQLARHQAPTDDATTQWASPPPMPTTIPAPHVVARAPAKARLNEWAQRNPTTSSSLTTFDEQHGECGQAFFCATVTIGRWSATSALHPRKKLAENDACEKILVLLAE